MKDRVIFPRVCLETLLSAPQPKHEIFMPRDSDRENRRPPGKRGPPSRGGGFHGDKGPRGGRRPGGGFRKDGDAPRGEGRSSRPAGKRFGEKRAEGRSEGKSFGDKRPFAPKGPGFRKDGDRPPRREFSRDGAPARPSRDRTDRPQRSEARSRDDRPKRDFRPREDRGERRDDKRPRSDAPRGSFRKDGDRPPRRDFKRDEQRGDVKRGEGRPPRRDFKDRSAGGDRPWQSRSSAPRGDFKRGERPDREARGGERTAPRDAGKRFDRPRGDKPFGKPRDERRDARPGGDRPRFPRDRDERPHGDRARQERPRIDRVARTSHAWRDHPRSEAGDERHERSYEPRPAFGGRGEYRERKPDFRRREAVEAPPAKAKKAGDRIAKLMARAGLCSRRDAEEWIREGRVSVNGRVITSPALDVTPQDAVLVDGAPLPERERTRLFLYHKPRGLVTTHADPEGRPTVFESLPEGLPRLISIGRLDFNTEGLLLLTNDGGLARVLELPDTGWLRRYRVRAHGAIDQERLDGLRKGIEIDGVKYGPIEAALERDQGANVWILFAIREGKNREVRNVMAHLGLEVNRLIRVSYGPFQLGELAEGEVQEVRSRMLRDQLGERIAAAAGADFGLPTHDGEGGREAPADETSEKPRRRAGVIADRKGRRVLVERSGREGDDGDDKPRRKPPTPYKGKRDRAHKDS
jgi:23S rRNA pseudouridine2605 synthase